MQDIPRTTSASTRPKKKVKARRISPRGPVAPKPSGVFAEPIGKVTVKDKPAPKPKAPRRAPAVLDVLPTKPGENSKPYRPPTAKKVVRKAKRVRAAAQHEARDTKGDAERGRALDYLAAHPEILHPEHPGHGSLMATITAGARLGEGAAKAGLNAGRFAKKTASAAAPYVATAVLPAIAGTAHALGKGSTFNKIAANAANDFFDIPANAVPSLYYEGKLAVEASVARASGQHERANELGRQVIHDQTQPYVDLAKHPGKSFVEHPLGTALLVSGAEGTVGRVTGKALRAAPVKALRDVASTKRAAIPGPGDIAVADRRSYSKNINHKAVQVAAESAGRKVRKARRAPVMNDAAIARRVTEDVSAARVRVNAAEGRAIKDARKAMGRKPTAATSLVAQGASGAARADIEAQLARLETEAGSLSGTRLRQNQANQRLLHDALKRYNPDRTRAQAEAYTKLAAQQEQEVLSRGLVTPTTAEHTRLAGAKITGRKVSAPIKARRTAANRALNDAKRNRAQAAATLQQALVDARAHQNGLPPAVADRLRRADAAHETAVAAQAVAIATVDAAKTAALRDRLPDTIEPAYVSHNPGGDVRPAALPAKAPRLAVDDVRSGKALRQGIADLHPDRLFEQAADTARRITAADNHKGFVERWSHRESKGGPVRFYSNSKTASNAAADLTDSTGTAWVPMRAAVDHEGKYTLVPKAAADRLAEHAQQTTNPLQGLGQHWTRATLATRPRWLAGQAIEPTFRATVAHAGPRSYITARKVLKGLGPEDAAAVKAATIGEGGLTGQALKRERPSAARDLSKVQRLARRHGSKEVAAAWNGFTNLMLGTLNHAAQQQQQMAMLGKAIRDELLDDRFLKLSEEAMQQAMRGAVNTDVQSALARRFDDMNGKYSRMSPGKRAAISTFTPFAMWWMSSLKFLGVVLPRDHPTLTALIVTSNQASEKWREANDMVFGSAPGYLQGSIPGADGSKLLLGRYLPFGAADDDSGIFGSGVGMLLPQWQGVIAALQRSEDWQGKPLRADGEKDAARNAAAAVSSIVTGLIPFAQQAASTFGVRTPDVSDNTDPKKGTTLDRLRRQADPFQYTRRRGTAAPVKAKRLPRGSTRPALPALPAVPSRPTLPTLPTLP